MATDTKPLTRAEVARTLVQLHRAIRESRDAWVYRGSRLTLREARRLDSVLQRFAVVLDTYPPREARADTPNLQMLAAAALATDKARRRVPRAKVASGTHTIGMGALTFDVDLARAHGWTDADIDAFWAKVQPFMLWGNERAANRHPERYNVDKMQFLGKIPRPSLEPEPSE
jgi:hypothetical protein